MEPNERTLYIEPYTFADYFDRTIKMIGLTWRTSLAVGLGVLVPLTILLKFAFSTFFGSLSHAMLDIAPNSEPDISSFAHIAAPLLGVGAVSTLAGLAFLFVSTVVIVSVSREAFGIRHAQRTHVVVAWGDYFGKLIVQGLIKGAIIAGATLLSLLPIGGLILMAVAVPGLAVPAGIFAFLAYVAMVLLLAWFGVTFYLAPQAIIVDGEPIFASFGRTAYLVRGNWWRTFGTMILVRLIFSFASGLVTSPIIAASLLPFIADMVRTGGSLESTQYATQIFEGLSAASTGFAIAALVQGLLYAFLLPVFWSLFYIDLRIRKGEIPPASLPDGASPGAPGPEGTSASVTPPDAAQSPQVADRSEPVPHSQSPSAGEQGPESGPSVSTQNLREPGE